jgi:hypothetical protein
MRRQAKGSSDAKRFGGSLAVSTSGIASTSRGLVGDTVFAVLPNIKPIHTFTVTLAMQSVSECAHPIRPAAHMAVDLLVQVMA